jgi:hypothetical protein
MRLGILITEHYALRKGTNQLRDTGTAERALSAASDTTLEALLAEPAVD